MPASSLVLDVLRLVESVTWIDERHILEFLLLKEGRKPVLRIPLADHAEYQMVVHFCHRHALTVSGSERKSVVAFTNTLGEQYVTWADLDDPRPGGRVIYCSQDEASASAAERAERENDSAQLGALLGYPPCCVQAYDRMADDGIWIERLLPQQSVDLPWQANKLAYALYGASLFPDFFPCALTCTATAALTEESHRLLTHHGLGSVAARHERLMRAPIQIAHNVMRAGGEAEAALVTLPPEAASAERLALHADFHPRSAVYRLTFS